MMGLETPLTCGPQLPRRGAGAKNGVFHILPRQTSHFLARQGRHTVPLENLALCTWGKSWEEGLITAEGFPGAQRAEQVETELLGRSYREADSVSTRGGN